MAKKKKNLPNPPYTQEEWLYLLDLSRQIIEDYCQFSSDHCDGRIIKEFIEQALFKIQSLNPILIDALCYQFHDCKDLDHLAEEIKKSIHFKDENESEF